METTLLTKENAHRVTMVRRVDAPESEPVAFLFRGKRHGYCSYSHLVGESGQGRNPARRTSGLGSCGSGAPGLSGRIFQAGVQLLQPHLLLTRRAGESDIASHEKEPHEDLQSMPEQQRERYMETTNAISLP